MTLLFKCIDRPTCLHQGIQISLDASIEQFYLLLCIYKIRGNKKNKNFSLSLEFLIMSQPLSNYHTPHTPFITQQYRSPYKWQWNCGSKWIDYQTKHSQVNNHICYITSFRQYTDYLHLDSNLNQFTMKES